MGVLTTGLWSNARNHCDQQIALELLELEKTFDKAIKEPVPVWLGKLWDLGVDEIGLTALETEKKNEMQRQRK